MSKTDFRGTKNRLQNMQRRNKMNEFRVVLQIEQLDENGQPLCTYGPEPITLLKTDDADEAMEYIEKHTIEED